MIDSYFNNHLPPIFSADAEPTLINRKIKGSKKFHTQIRFINLIVYGIVSDIISDDLSKIGINQNYAPVIDASPNKVVSKRSFGLNMDTVIKFSQSFINHYSNQQYYSNCKTFSRTWLMLKEIPTKNLIFIDGQMKRS